MDRLKGSEITRRTRHRQSPAIEATTVATATEPSGSGVVVGTALTVYACLLLAASYAFWSYAENLFLWAWLYHFLKLIQYAPYALALKGVSVTLALLGLLALLAALILVVDGIARRRNERRS